MLCSEEVNVSQELAKDSASTASNTALYSNNYNSTKDRTQKMFIKNKSQQQYQNPSPPVSTQSAPVTNSCPTSQICGKTGHIALNCWHRCNFKFAPTVARSPQAFQAQLTINNSE
ncbi:hypothetical protein KFK09_005151 [Dendrobium nobile]|uniref:CCHC-type domain-containing protein n=1 Tax=Dendrobium nobile TaxID=94219 RepID=A0A8T3C0H3_DENNO|nr:hypothetical protein KFK09_005151 [Dendrobium nobile]